MTLGQHRSDWHADNGNKTWLIDYPLTNSSIVLDVGGYAGDWTAELLNKVRPRNPNLTCDPQVYIFEPVGDFATGLRNRFGYLGNVKIVEAALSDHDGWMWIARDADSTSLHHALADEKIETLDVCTFMKTLDREVDLASINIEGHEFRLLDRILQNNYIGQFKHLQVQFHSFYPDAGRLRNELRSRLELTHEQTYCYPFVWEGWKRRG